MARKNKKGRKGSSARKSSSPRKSGKSRSQLEAENDLLRRGRLARDWAQVAKVAIKWFGLAAIFYCGYLAIDSLAGKVTFADISVIAGEPDCGTQSEISVLWLIAIVAAFIVAAIGVAYGRAQAERRRDALALLGDYRKLFEQAHDAGRSSSGLLPDGKEPDDDNRS